MPRVISPNKRVLRKAIVQLLVHADVVPIFKLVGIWVLEKYFGKLGDRYNEAGIQFLLFRARESQTSAIWYGVTECDPATAFATSMVVPERGAYVTSIFFIIIPHFSNGQSLHAHRCESLFVSEDESLITKTSSQFM